MAKKDDPLLMQLGARKVSYRLHGSGSRRVLFFHGFFGSSAQIDLFDSILATQDLQVLSLDRPGYGQTTAAHGSQIATSNLTAEAVIQNLGWRNFEVVGISGGAPFAYAFTEHFPKLVNRLCLISPLGPIGMSDFSRIMPLRARLGLRAAAALPDVFLKQIGKAVLQNERPIKSNLFFPLSQSDQAATARPASQRSLQKAMREAIACGWDGIRGDAQAVLEAWPSTLGRYTGPVQIWHGTADLVIPFSMTIALGRFIPAAQTELVPTEGHFSLALDRISEMMSLRVKSS
jgi:pimeloyl-ACP methyl ester carboxylesterase